MRFIHIADTHLGAVPEAGAAYSEGRPGEIWDAFERVIDLCESEQTDLLLIAGDMFHRQPLLRELKEVNYLFSKLTHTKVVFIVGNHDYLKHDSYYRGFKWNENVFPILSSETTCVPFEEMGVAVYGFSYDTREIRKPRYDLISAPGDYPIEILLAHGGDEKHVPLNKNQLAVNGFSYTALGHIHKPQIVVAPPEHPELEEPVSPAVYAGALEPLDVNDTGEHGFIRGEITKNRIALSFEPAALREYIHLEIPVHSSTTNGALKNRVRSEIEERGIQNIYKVILNGYRDPDIVFELGQMDQYGNITAFVDETKPSYDFEKLLEENPDNLLGRFIRQYIGSEEGSVEYQALCEGVQALICR